MEITILGRVPSKKNSVVISTRGGRVMKFPSSQYQQWHKDASRQILGMYKKGIDRAEVTIKLYAPDARKSDLTNKAESIMDLLVDNGVLTDDNWFVCSKVTLVFVEIDKKNPRVDIIIDQITGGAV